jgi:protein-tyrosine phosphatase
LNAKPGYGYVHPFLAIGSKPPTNQPLNFNALVLCAQEYQPSGNHFPKVMIIRAPFEDTVPISKEEIETAYRAGLTTAQLIRDRRRVLVTCNQGRNRSGLVTGFALMDLGVRAEDAIVRIRKARGDDALSNDYFVKLLHSCDTLRA